MENLKKTEPDETVEEFIERMFDAGADQGLLGGSAAEINKKLDLEDFAYAEFGMERDRDVMFDSMPEDLSDFCRTWKEFASQENHHKIRGSMWQLFFEDRYKYYSLAEQVGFDYCQFAVCVTGVDTDQLIAVLAYCDPYYQEQIYKDFDSEDPNYPDLDIGYPKVKVTRRGYGQHTVLGTDYGRISIELSPYVNFVFQANNIPDKSDFYLLNTYVAPPGGHECLGNIRNYNYDQQMKVIYDAMNELERGFYIRLDRNDIQIRKVEVNCTFEMECDGSELFRALDFSRMYMKAYTSAFYSQSSNMEVDITDGSFFVEGNRLTGLRIFNKGGNKGKEKTICFKVYDKGEETEQRSEYQLKSPDAERVFDSSGSGGKVLLEHDSSKKRQLVRFEAAFYKNNTVASYFGRIPNICAMSQEVLEAVYQKVVVKCFVKTWKKYCRERKRVIKEVCDKINFDSCGWQEALLKAAYGYEHKVNCTSPLIWSVNDLKDMFRHHKILSEKPSTFYKEMNRVLSDSAIFPAHNDRLYNVYSNFIYKALGYGGLSERRRIGYVKKQDYDDLKQYVSEYASEYQWLKEHPPTDCDDIVPSFESRFGIYEIFSAADAELDCLGDMDIDQVIDDSRLSKLIQPLKDIGLDKRQIFACFDKRHQRLAYEEGHVTHVVNE